MCPTISSSVTMREKNARLGPGQTATAGEWQGSSVALPAKGDEARSSQRHDFSITF